MCRWYGHFIWYGVLYTITYMTPPEIRLIDIYRSIAPWLLGRVYGN